MENYYWLVLMAILIVIEIITLGLATIWFALGALAAFIIALCGGNVFVQVAVFFVVSFITLYFTRPLAIKYVNKDRTRTNVDSLVGEKARVIETIDNINSTGRVVINGQEWMARSEQDEIIELGEVVCVNRITGVKVIVSK